MRHLLALAVVSLLPTLSVADESPAKMATGVVYVDANENSKQDPNELGLPGVAVSNGELVTQTDANGRWQLPATDDTTFFVIKPRGYRTPTDKHHLPKFYYLHKPNGSPDDDYLFPGVEPTGTLPVSIDFPLIKQPEPERFRVLLMGDPQPETIEQVRHYANDVLAEVMETGATFAIALGDLVGDDLSLFEELNKVQATVGIPWYNIHGNHDINFMSVDDDHADETFERVYGPANYAFQYGKVHFIVLDNVYWIGRQLDAAGKPTNKNYEGRLTDKQLRFVANYVKLIPREDRIVVCFHIPLVNELAVQHSTPQARQLMQILSSHPHTMTLTGHTHIQTHDFLGPEAGYTPTEGTEHAHHNLATASGSWFRGPTDERGLPVSTMRDGAPNGYVLADFDGNDYRLRYQAAGFSPDYQLAIHTPAVIAAGEVSQTPVLVNVFNGSEKSTTRMRIDQGDWTIMQQHTAPWPPYAALAKTDLADAIANQRKPLPDAMETTHLWRAMLPGDLAPGVHVIEVETTDQFGQTDHGRRLIDVRE